MNGLSVYGNRADLLNGLKSIIIDIEKLAIDGHVINLYMNDYSRCPIGRVIKKNNLYDIMGCYGIWEEDKVIKHLFGIDVVFEQHKIPTKMWLFDSCRFRDGTYLKFYNEDQYKVIMLFTSHICATPYDDYISDEEINVCDWLEKAKEVYFELSGKKI